MSGESGGSRQPVTSVTRKGRVKRKIITALLALWGVFILIRLVSGPDDHVPSVEEEAFIMAAAPFLLAAVVFAILVAVVVCHIRAKQPESLPSRPASPGYTLAIKLFSTFAFLFVLALCFSCVVELLQAGGAGPGSPVMQKAAVYVRTSVWGIKLGTTTTARYTGDGGTLAILGVLVVCSVSMLVLCVEDWRRTFGTPDRERLLWTVFLGFAGGWYFLTGDRTGGFLRLGFFLAGCLLCWLGATSGAPVFSLGLIVITTLWAREILRAANGK